MIYLFSFVQSETTMVADKHNIEKEQNSQLKNQITQLSQLEQEQKLQVQQQDSTIQNLQVGPTLVSTFWTLAH